MTTQILITPYEIKPVTLHRISGIVFAIPIAISFLLIVLTACLVGTPIPWLVGSSFMFIWTSIDPSVNAALALVISCIGGLVLAVSIIIVSAAPFVAHVWTSDLPAVALDDNYDPVSWFLGWLVFETILILLVVDL